MKPLRYSAVLWTAIGAAALTALVNTVLVNAGHSELHFLWLPVRCGWGFRWRGIAASRRVRRRLVWVRFWRLVPWLMRRVRF